MSCVWKYVTKRIWNDRRIHPFQEQSKREQPVPIVSTPYDACLYLPPIPEENTGRTSTVVSRITTTTDISLYSKRSGPAVCFYDEINRVRESVSEIYEQPIYKFSKPESASDVFPHIDSLPGSVICEEYVIDAPQ